MSEYEEAVKKSREFVNLYEWVFWAVNHNYTVRDADGGFEDDLIKAKTLVAEDGGEPCGRFFVTQVGLEYGKGVLFPSPDSYQEYLAE